MIDVELVAGGGGDSAEIARVGADDQVTAAEGAFDDAGVDDVGGAAATGQLAVSEQECRDLLAATMDGALWHRLVNEQGWPEERFALVLGTMWVAALVRLAQRDPPVS